MMMMMMMMMLTVVCVCLLTTVAMDDVMQDLKQLAAELLSADSDSNDDEHETI